MDTIDHNDWSQSAMVELSVANILLLNVVVDVVYTVSSIYKNYPILQINRPLDLTSYWRGIGSNMAANKEHGLAAEGAGRRLAARGAASTLSESRPQF